ncbi:MAG: glycosyltransferase [Nitrospiraceae bacterium]|nr:glycosyltransferase [Nitrospiraceae bacterium]
MSEDPTVVLRAPAASTYRVAMVGACPYPVPQGSQVLLRQTALGIRERGHDVRLVVYGHGIGQDSSGLDVHRCRRIPGVRRTAAGPSLAKPILDRLLVRTLKRVIDEHRIDLVHAHNYEGLWVALKAGKRPIVYHAHNAMADELPHFLLGGRLLGRRLDRTLPRRADHIIAPHKRLAEYLLSCRCEASRISVIPPPADIQTFQQATVSDENALGIPPILYTGNQDRYQNLDLLFKAVARLCTDMPSARLIVATAQEAELADADVLPTPDVDSLRKVLAQDSVVACPRVSWSGYPIKLLNAMAAGRAVVACESAAHPITHRHDGIVVADNDVTQFAKALQWLMTQPKVRARLGRNARATAIANHGPAQIATSIEQVYERVMKAADH